MKITKEFLKRGMSRKGGLNKYQFAVLGLKHPLRKGWQKRLIGKELSEDKASKFIELKNWHIINHQKNSFYADASYNLPWEEQYKHPNWQRLRLIIFERDDFKCTICGNDQDMLHVHHLKYSKRKFIWEVPRKWLTTLCETCHKKQHGHMK